MALAPWLSVGAQSPDTGIVRISDRGVKNVQPIGYKGAGEYHAPSGDVMYGGMDCPCPHCQGKKSKGCKFCEHYCSHSPDHGYSIPGKWPIQRRGVQYNSYYPAAWHGTPAAMAAAAPVYPMVYQPTDTTQLGFYYQHVPFWMPQPNPLPQRPIPAQWHIYAPVAYASQFENGYVSGHGMMYGDVIYESASPTPIQAPSAEPAKSADPLPPAPPPAPLQESAVPQPIERIGY